MKQILSVKYCTPAFFLLLLLSCGKGKGGSNVEQPEPPVQVTGAKIKVMTYNIHIGNPPSKPAGIVDLPAIAAVIKAQDPDLVALQEVDVNTNRSGTSLDEAKELARLTGMNYFYTKAIDYDGGQFGDAVLSRFPILESKGYELPVTAKLGGETRSVALITVEKEGQRFLFASTHLDHLTAEDNRMLQATELVKIVKTFTLPLIIAGDFNATPMSNPLTILRQELSWGCKSSCPLTFSAQKPGSTIDYVMMRPAEKFNVLSYVTVNESYASDHLPLVTEIQLVK
ncbi:endonuclease/exonuclease/phosphatase family metal-dependent hydrolase [Pedobacter sp. AK017]|uniref:endonuclease/exonuclease/phosphatase family protein n=1 Tax=Pedobacter sp. AK017 TaxID=2723073 RepID=UPI00183F1E7C|nr:endonuclease/exonuclease/phosphatase family protein [Pedobacter sp. AK017]MBB5437418.1 endonuclease/exonuclease/phosphatase family metal-dependent hydrolase [Pedobacter sp. AK017]